MNSTKNLLIIPNMGYRATIPKHISLRKKTKENQDTIPDIPRPIHTKEEEMKKK